jgi:hypothetical protein
MTSHCRAHEQVTDGSHEAAAREPSRASHASASPADRCDDDDDSEPFDDDESSSSPELTGPAPYEHASGSAPRAIDASIPEALPSSSGEIDAALPAAAGFPSRENAATTKSAAAHAADT